jgi:hypothetical protein
MSGDEFVLKIVSRGEVLGKFLVKRGFSPRVFSALSGLLPRVGVVSIGKTYLCLNLGLRIGIERVMSNASAGDVGYSPHLQGLLFFTSDSSECSFLKAALIGKLLTSVETIRSLKEGDVASVEWAEAI